MVGAASSSEAKSASVELPHHRAGTPDGGDHDIIIESIPWLRHFVAQTITDIHGYINLPLFPRFHTSLLFWDTMSVCLKLQLIFHDL